MLTNASEVHVKNFLSKFKGKPWRTMAADTLMITFIVLTSIGAYMIAPPVGLITGGACCGLYGFLLGSE